MTITIDKNIVDCADGGKCTIELVDLFEYPERLPLEVQELIESFGEIETYDQCAQLKDALEKVGYTCDYYLDAVPHSLRKI